MRSVGRLAVTPVAVIDVADGSLRTNQTVLVEGDRIITVGPADAVSVSAEATVADGTDGYLIPGLWDMHVHAVSEDRVDSFPRLFLANGITGFRDMWGSLALAERMKASVASGDLPSPPRTLVAGNLIDGPGSSLPGASIASSPEEGRRIVDSLHAEGVPFVKAYHGLSPETFFAILEQAREHGLPAVGHVPFMVRAADASDAGYRSMEHLIGLVTGCTTDEETVLEEWRTVLEMARTGDMGAVAQQYMVPQRLALATQDDELCRRLAERFVENKTWQVPTLVSLRGKAYLREFAAAGDPREAYFWPPSRWTGGRPFGFPMSEEHWDLLQRQYSREKEIVGIMADAGVPFLAGSDTPTPWAFPGFGLHDELELLVEAGMTPLKALRTATLNPARFLGRGEDLGAVEEGKLADLVLLEANPLEDIRNTRRIRAVVAGGRLYRQADLDRLLAEVQASVEEAGGQE